MTSQSVLPGRHCEARLGKLRIGKRTKYWPNSWQRQTSNRDWSKGCCRSKLPRDFLGKVQPRRMTSIDTVIKPNWRLRINK